MAAARRLLILLTLVLVVVTSVPGIEPETSRSLGLAGAVQTVTEYNRSYSWNNGRWVSSAAHTVKVDTFSESGLLVERSMYNSSGTRTNHSEYAYYDSGILRQVDTVRYDYDGDVTGYQTTEYGPGGELVSDETTNAGRQITNKFERIEEERGYRLENSQYNIHYTRTYFESSEFDDDGRITRQERRPNYGDRSVRSYEYDEDGSLVQVTLRIGGRTTGRWEYSYDAGGHLIEVVHRDRDDNTLAVRRYEYDSRGRLRAEYAEHLDLDGLEHSWAYRYDLRGNLVEQEYHQSYTDFVVSTESEYTGDNRVASSIVTDTFGRTATRSLSAYDDELTVMSRTDNHGIVTGYSETIERDSQGRVVYRERRGLDGNWQSASRNAFDTHGLLLEQSTLNADGSYQVRTTYDNEYDENGNWIRITRLVSTNATEDYGRTHQVRTRRITYY